MPIHNCLQHYNLINQFFFQIKFTLFGNKRDIVSVQSLACLVIGYTLVAHGRICIYKSQDFLFIFDPPSFGRSYLVFQTQMKKGCKWLKMVPSEGLPRAFQPGGLEVTRE